MWPGNQSKLRENWTKLVQESEFETADQRAGMGRAKSRGNSGKFLLRKCWSHRHTWTKLVQWPALVCSGLHSTGLTRAAIGLPCLVKGNGFNLSWKANTMSHTDQGMQVSRGASQMNKPEITLGPVKTVGLSQNVCWWQMTKPFSMPRLPSSKFLLLWHIFLMFYLFFLLYAFFLLIPHSGLHIPLFSRFFGAHDAEDGA
mgnify:CR=1 FL=1